MKTDILSVSELDDMPWVLIGTGGYTQILLAKCRSLGVRLPEAIIGYCDAGLLDNVIVIAPEHYNFIQDNRLIFGSDVYQMEIITRLKPLLPKDFTFYDCSADIWSENNISLYNQFSFEGITLNYIIIICNSPNDQVNNWLKNFINNYQSKNFVVKLKHPLQHISDEELSEAKFIYIWNGSIPIFEPLKQRMDDLQVDYNYLECGFFPQHLHFYIDEKGINNKRSLVNDRLAWVTDDMKNNAIHLRKTFFAEINEKQQDFIFVPLQLAHDSNIQLNSRFKNGMQEFIDFIERCYPNEALVFKKHPKDPSIYTSKNGRFSALDSRILIMQSRLVHGINSTVLFEAALAGKPVIAEGECLLNHKFASIQTVIAAMIASQFHINGPFNILDNGKIDAPIKYTLLSGDYV